MKTSPHSWPIGLCAILVAATSLSAGETPDSSQPPIPRQSIPIAVQTTLLSGPIPFEPNRGQAPSAVKFISRAGGYMLGLTADAAWLVAPGQTSIRMRLVGANAHAAGQGLEPTRGRSNYFRGKDPSRWVRGVEHYGRVQFSQVYPGIDVVYYGSGKQLEHDFVVAPGADPRRVRMRFDGAHLKLSPAGDLVVGTAGGELILKAPVAYQEGPRGREPVGVQYVRRGRREASFAVADYDRSRPLVIDPILLYSTFLGGTWDDYATGVAADASGNTYVAGSTFSHDFPASGQNAGILYDVFVTKLGVDGGIVYSNYIGGSYSDNANGLAVDAAGAAYVAGSTASQDFPTVNPVQTWGGNDRVDAFLIKLDAGGNLSYSTYIGGSGSDIAYGVALDAAGYAYVGGWTNSTDLPIVNALQPSLGGNTDGFVVKVNTNAVLADYIYATYLGGSGSDVVYGLAVHPSGLAYVTGSTQSPDFPVQNAVQPTSGGGEDAFLAKIGATGSILLFSTYLGGSAEEAGQAVTLDATGHAYVVGYTYSPDFPTVAALDPDHHEDSDAFLTKLDPAGAIVYSTYIGSAAYDAARAVAVDSANEPYVTGITHSPGLPPGGAYPKDVFVIKLAADGASRLFLVKLGGTPRTYDEGRAIAIDGSGTVHLAGVTSSPDFPVVNPLQPYRGGPGDHVSPQGDAFVTRLAAADISVSSATVPEGSGPQVVTLTATLTQPLTFPLTLDYRTEDGTAAGFTDYEPVQQSLTIPAGATIAEIPVGILGDFDYEGDETFSIVISPPGQTAPEFARGTITLTNDDAPGLTISDAVGEENPTTPQEAVFTVTLSPVNGSTVTVNYQTANGTAEAGSDYVAKSGTLTFAPGEATKDVPVTILGNAPVEGAETFTVNLSGASGAAIVHGQGMGTILDLPPSGDLSGDGRSDILWRNTDGALFIWLMNGQNLGGTYLDPISQDWVVQQVADFNGDGHADILWREQSSGNTYMWLLDGATVIGAGYTNSQADNTWQVQGTGDLNGDGKSDIVWRKVGPGTDTGAMFLWLMNGAQIVGATYLDPISLDWEVQRLGDYDGDGKFDILWRERNNGNTYLWLMNGAVVKGAGYTASQADLSWRIEGTGDFNRDGRSDILWRKVGAGPDTGAMFVWLMNGTNLGGTYLDPISSNWDVQGLGDFNGDGRSDILWREMNTGETYLWFMDGARLIGAGYTASQADLSWQIQYPR